MKLSNTVKFLTDKDYRFYILSMHGCYDRMDDGEYIKRTYKAVIGKDIDLEDPKLFSEKLQWLKLHNRDPKYTQMVDKYAVRSYIEKKLGQEYLIPLLGVWDDPDNVDFDSLPEQFVLKCNHNSGLGMCVCKDKSALDLPKVKRELKKGFDQNYYLLGREWPYKDVEKKIICEKFMKDESEGLVDYKFFCFNGVCDCVMVCIDRHIGDTKFYFFDKSWELKRLNIRGKNAPEGFTLRKPECMDRMFEIAEGLSRGMPFVRVDLYECSGKIYFGELTFFPDSGFDPNLLPETDEYFGSLIDLSIVKEDL